jgi:hypothetical protein
LCFFFKIYDKILIMQALFTKKTAGLALFFILSFPLMVNAQDSRNLPAAVNLIMDGSQALKDAGNEPLDWVCGYFVDTILGDDDVLTIWSAGGRAQIIFSGTVKDSGGKEGVKKALRSIQFQGSTADFTGALREAAQTGSSGRAITYTLLISGDSSLGPSLSGSGASLLKYSRVQEFTGWRALTIALNAESRIRQAAAAYMAGN